jgi:hypothetical protein
MKSATRAVNRLLRADADPRTAFFTTLFVATTRIVLEHNARGVGIDPAGLIPTAAERVAFYTATFLVFVAALRSVLPAGFRGVPNIVAIGMLFGLVPPLLSTLLPSFGAAGHPRFDGWQWHFHAPAQRLFAETMTLWSAIAACGSFVAWVTGSWWRAAAAAVLGWAGLAWLTMVVPSGLAQLHRGFGTVANGWEPGMVFAISAVALHGISHPRISRVWMRRVPGQVPFAGALLLGSLLADSSPFEAAGRAVLACWVLVAGPALADTNPVPGYPERPLAWWGVALSAVLLASVAIREPGVALAGFALLIVRIFASELAAFGALRHIANIMTAICALSMGLSPVEGIDDLDQSPPVRPLSQSVCGSRSPWRPSIFGSLAREKLGADPGMLEARSADTESTSQ